MRLPSLPTRRALTFVASSALLFSTLASVMPASCFQASAGVVHSEAAADHSGHGGEQDSAPQPHHDDHSGDCDSCASLVSECCSAKVAREPGSHIVAISSRDQSPDGAEWLNAALAALYPAGDSGGWRTAKSPPVAFRENGGASHLSSRSFLGVYLI